MAVLLLIRHATNDFVKTGRLPGRTPNIHLNEEGRRQADALRAHLAPQHLDAVYSSQLERAIETAWRIAAHHVLPIYVRPNLADIDNGTFTGRVIRDITEDPASKDLWKIVVETPSAAAFPNGEAMLDMQRRVVSQIDALALAHPDVETPAAEPNASPTRTPQIIAVVMHADPIKAALAHYLGMPFDFFQRLGVAPASISTVVLNPADPAHKPQILGVNRIPY
jgi:probable phosphoglycerate mutase